MAMCKNCPALKEFPELAVIEHLVFGNGCPDDIYGVYGGDCYSTFSDDEEDEFDKYDEFYDFGELKADLVEIRGQEADA